MLTTLDAAKIPLRYAVRRRRGNVEPELMWFTAALPRGHRVIDVGANLGIYSHALVRRHTVEAFEPLPGCAAALTAYSRVRRRLHVHQVALSNAPGEMPLYVPERNGKPDIGWASFERDALHAFGEPLPVTETIVTVRTLDSFDFRDVAGIKVDVEGWEVEALEGGAETIRRERPVLLVEIDRRFTNHSVPETILWLEQLGYDGAFLDEYLTERPVAEYDVEKYQRWELDRRPNGRLANTFLFRPK